MVLTSIATSCGWRNSTHKDHKMDEPDQEIWNIADVSHYLRLSKTKTWEMARSNVLPHFRVGVKKNGKYLFRRGDIIAWVAAQMEDSKSHE